MVVATRRLTKAGLVDTKLINQVHDSLIFDAPRKDVEQVCEIVINTFEDLPKLIESYFGFEFNVPMTGSAKIGETWDDVKDWRK